MINSDANRGCSNLTYLLCSSPCFSPSCNVKAINIKSLSLSVNLHPIVWIALFSGAWEHDNEEGKLKTPGEEHQFWESLWFIHIFVYVLAYLELILKGFLLYYLIADFKEKSKIKDLLTLNYDDSKNNPVTQSMDGDKMNIENSMVNESNNSFKEDFQNNF